MPSVTLGTKIPNYVPGSMEAIPDQYGAVASEHLAAGAAIGNFSTNSIANTYLAGNFAQVSVVDGEDETSTHQITCPGITSGDQVSAVLVFTTKASIATMAAHAGTLTPTTDAITPGTEVDNTGNQYLIFWTKLT